MLFRDFRICALIGTGHAYTEWLKTCNYIQGRFESKKRKAKLRSETHDIEYRKSNRLLSWVDKHLARKPTTDFKLFIFDIKGGKKYMKLLFKVIPNDIT